VLMIQADSSRRHTHFHAGKTTQYLHQALAPSSTPENCTCGPCTQNIKRELKKDADPELSQLLDEVSYEELLNSDKNDFFRRLAQAKLGPYLTAMGLDQDPLSFFSEASKAILLHQGLHHPLPARFSTSIDPVGMAYKSPVGLSMLILLTFIGVATMLLSHTNMSPNGQNTASGVSSPHHYYKAGIKSVTFDACLVRR